EEIKKVIDTNFWHSYSAFATHYPSYYANLIQPTFRVLKNPVVRKRLFNGDSKVLDSMLKEFYSREEIFEEPTEYTFHNFLSELGGCSANDRFLEYFYKSDNGVSRSKAISLMYLY